MFYSRIQGNFNHISASQQDQTVCAIFNYISAKLYVSSEANPWGECFLWVFDG